MTVAVVSSIYGAYDTPKIQPRQTVDADWILVTDRPVDAPGWRVVVEPRPHMHPCLAAKVAKCRPDLYTDVSTIVSVWLDGSCQLLDADSLQRLLDGATGGGSIAQVAHPDRDCVYDEAEFCVPIPKYADQPMMQQVDHYRELGHPGHGGLYATGLIVRNHSSFIDLAEFGDAWLREQMRWTFQDQLSEVPLLRRRGIYPHTLPFSLHDSGVFEWHAAHH